MKTQIIQLEAHDDTLSVRDKMDWSQTPRVLLVWPEKGKVLRTRLDLILLDRYCSSHGSQLAVLATDREVIFQAEEAGLPVFQSRSEAQLQPWRKSFREFQRQELEKSTSKSFLAEILERSDPQPRRKLPLWARIPIFTVGVLSVITLAAFLLPSAEIKLVPNNKQQMITIPVQSEIGRNIITLSGIVPARELVVSVDGQLSTPTNGTASIPAEYAYGEVVFINLGEGEISIPQDTILSSTGETPVLFRTLNAGNIPAEQGGQITLEVEALLPGISGNLPANQITKINLEVGAELTVNNPLPTEGGTDIQVPAPTLTDRLKLTREMTQLLEEKAWEEVDRFLGDGDILLSNRLQDPEVIEEEFSPQDDSPGELLWLVKSAQYKVYYVSNADLQELASELVTAQYQDNSYHPDLNSIQIGPITTPERESDDVYSLEVLVNWVERQTINSEEISEEISAKPIDEAERTLTGMLDLAEDPRIILQPSWWPRIPALPFRIHVIQGEG